MPDCETCIPPDSMLSYAFPALDGNLIRFDQFGLNTSRAQAGQRCNTPAISSASLRGVVDWLVVAQQRQFFGGESGWPAHRVTTGGSDSARFLTLRVCDLPMPCRQFATHLPRIASAGSPARCCPGRTWAVAMRTAIWAVAIWGAAIKAVVEMPDSRAAKRMPCWSCSTLCGTRATATRVGKIWWTSSLCSKHRTATLVWLGQWTNLVPRSTCR